MSSFAFAHASRLLRPLRTPRLSTYVATTPQLRRWMSSEVPDVRAKLMTELKTAMKTKDTVASTTLRSVLSEVYAADKAASGTASSAAVTAILRKAAQRRTDAAAEFTKASRPDLAEKEAHEASLLNALLPPLLPAADIDAVLRRVLVEPTVAAALSAGGPPQRALGQVFKGFYTYVDKTSVDPDLVRQRAQALMAEGASTA